MKLKDKLKEHYRVKLENENIKFPTIMGRIFDELEQKEYVLQLTYGTVQDLNAFLGATSPYDYFVEL